MRDVAAPLLDEVGRYGVDGQSEEVLDLGGEDGHGNTARKSNYDGVGDVLDDGAELQHAEHDEEHACHERGYGEALKTILLDYTVYDDDESTRRTSNLHFAAAEQRDDESGYDGRDDAFLRRYARGNTKGNGKRQRHNAHNDACHEVAHERLAVVRLKRRKQLGFKIECFHPQILSIEMN